MDDEFQMTDCTPRAARSPEAVGQRSVSNNNADTSAALRETEQRCAKMLADAECKLLEERLAAQERETALREELARERTRAKAAVAGASSSASEQQERQTEELGRVGEHNRRLELQVRDLQKQLQESESRFHTEKRELIKTRASQLMSETSRRGQEGDIIARAIQVMAEHEAVVRSMEETSLAKLAGYMENFEREWVKRSREFEERKAAFESDVMSKAFAVLNQHTNTIQEIEHDLREKSISMLQEQSQAKLALEENLLRQFEEYKQEYKTICDNEYDNRCRLYDHTAEAREAKILEMLRNEREKLVAIERDAVKSSEVYKVQTLGEAMEEISKLKEDLTQQHNEQQQAAIQELMAQREALRKKEEDAVIRANAQIKEMEQQCAQAMQSAQDVVNDMHLKLAEQEAALQRTAAATDAALEAKKQRELDTLKTQMEEHWKEVVADLRTRHMEEVRRIVEEYQARRDGDLAEQFSKEQEMRRNFDARQLKFEDATEQKWASHVQEIREAHEQAQMTIDELRAEIETMHKKLSDQRADAASSDEMWSVKFVALQREQEELRVQSESEVRTKYETVIQEMLSDPKAENIDYVVRADYEKVVNDLREWEKKYLELRKSSEERWVTELEEVNTEHRRQLQRERDDRAAWEEDLLKKMHELRVELEADTRRKELEAERRVEAERQRLYDEANERVIDDRRDREAFEQRVREDGEKRVQQIQKELNEAYERQVQIFDERAEDREIQFEVKLRDLRMEKREIEEHAREAANASLEREKEVLRAEMSQIYAKLQEEQDKLTDEKSQLHLKYEETFQQAKQRHLMGLMGAMSEQLHYHAVRDEEWARFRQEEMALMLSIQHEHDELTARRFEEQQRRFESSCMEIVQQERATLDQREVSLREELDRHRTAMEAAARERAVQLLEERQRILEEAEARRVEAEADLWADLERKTLEREQEFDERRREYETSVKQRFEGLVEAERKRIDLLVEEQRRDNQLASERHEAALRVREEEWVRERMQLEEKERRRREDQYLEMRSQAENRIEAERRAKEQEVDRERARLTAYLDEQIAEMEANTRRRIESLTEDHERRISHLQLELQNVREKHIAEYTEMEKKRNEAREQYEADAARRSDRVVAELRELLETRSAEAQKRELDLREQHEKERRSYEETIKEQYEKMLRHFEEQTAATLKQREEGLHNLEKHRADELRRAVEGLEAKHADHEATMETTYRQELEAVRADFVAQIKEIEARIEDARDKQHTAEQEARIARKELDTVRDTQEQWKLEHVRATEQKYEALWSEAKAKNRREREEHARRMLEEEEKHLAKELVRKEADVKREVAEEERSITMDSAKAASNERAVKDRALLDMINSRKSKVYDMWNDLEISADERAVCSQKVVDAIASGDLHHAADELSAELRRLESLVPVLDVITRREFVQHKMNEMHTALELNPSLRVNPLRQKQLEEFERELTRLDDHLLSALPGLEAQQAAPFVYKGKRYLDVIEEARATSRTHPPPPSGYSPAVSRTGSVPGGTALRTPTQSSYSMGGGY